MAVGGYEAAPHLNLLPLGEEVRPPRRRACGACSLSIPPEGERLKAGGFEWPLVVVRVPLISILLPLGEEVRPPHRRAAARALSQSPQRERGLSGCPRGDLCVSLVVEGRARTRGAPTGQPWIPVFAGKTDTGRFCKGLQRGKGLRQLHLRSPCQGPSGFCEGVLRGVEGGEPAGELASDAVGMVLLEEVHPFAEVHRLEVGDVRPQPLDHRCLPEPAGRRVE